MKINAHISFLLVWSSLSINKADGRTTQHGALLTKTVHSVILRDNRVGLNTERSVQIYLPPGYGTSDRRYPVVYYLHNFYTNNEHLFADGQAKKLIEQGFEAGVIKEFILVAADYSTTLIGSFYENSPVSGR